MRSSADKHFGSVNSIKSLPENASYYKKQSHDFPSYYSCGKDSMIHFWDLNFDLAYSITAHRGSVNYMSQVTSSFNCPSIVSNGTPLLLTSGLGTDNTIKLWDLSRIRLLSEISVPSINKLAWGRNSIYYSNNSGNIYNLEVNLDQSEYQDLDVSQSDLNTSKASNDKPLSKVINWKNNEVGFIDSAITEMISNDQFLSVGTKSGQINRYTFY